MGQEHDLQIRYEAEELYVDQRLTYEQIAERMPDVSLSTLKRWGKDGQWRTMREERLEARRTLSHNLFELRQAMMEKAVGSKEAQDIYAVIRLEKLAQERSRKNDDKAPEIDRPKLFLEDLEFVAEVLKEVDPDGLKAFAKNFDVIIQRFKERDAQAA